MFGQISGTTAKLTQDRAHFSKARKNGIEKMCMKYVFGVERN